MKKLNRKQYNKIFEKSQYGYCNIRDNVYLELENGHHFTIITPILYLIGFILEGLKGIKSYHKDLIEMWKRDEVYKKLVSEKQNYNTK